MYSVRLFVEVYDHEVFLVFLFNYTIVQLILMPYTAVELEMELETTYW